LGLTSDFGSAFGLTSDFGSAFGLASDFGSAFGLASVLVSTFGLASDFTAAGVACFSAARGFWTARVLGWPPLALAKEVLSALAAVAC
jgi:hypothetical protein